MEPISLYINNAEGHLFNPPIKVEYNKDSKEISVYVDEFETITTLYNIDNFITKKLNTTEEKVKRMIEFDLAHAFGHISEDPNYDLFHWALYGNLKKYYKGELEPE